MAINTKQFRSQLLIRFPHFLFLSYKTAQYFSHLFIHLLCNSFIFYSLSFLFDFQYLQQAFHHFSVLFMDLSGECNLLGSVSSQQRFEATDIKALGVSQISDRPCYSSQVLDRPCYSSQISVTAACYSSVLLRKQQENTPSRWEGRPIQRRKEKRAQPFGSSFYKFFPPPRACPV